MLLYISHPLAKLLFFFFFKKNQYDYGNDDRLGDGNGERGGADTLDVIDMNLLARDDG